MINYDRIDISEGTDVNKPVYNKKILKIKIKFHGFEFTDFYDKETPKVDSNHSCLAVISLDFAFNKDGNYYPQILLKECKYTDKRVIRHFINNLSNFSYYVKSEEE